MINKVIALNELENGNIFTVPHSTNWYMCTDAGYINLENGCIVPAVDSKYWEKALLLYEYLGNMAIDMNSLTYLTEWWV